MMNNMSLEYQKGTQKGLNQFQIKILMAFLMVFDHIHYIPNLLSGPVVGIFHVITRIVGVWFAYCAVDGVMHTHNIKKYSIRLFTWAGIMLIGNQILNNMYSVKKIYITNNIFMTIAVGVLMIVILRKINNKLISYLSTAFIFLAGALFTEGGLTILPFMLITYLTYNKRKTRNISYIVLSILLFLTSFNDYGDISSTLDMLAFNSDFMFIFVLPFIYLYNGERGADSKFSKYFFYVFYPAHLWIIMTIAYIVSK